MGRDPVGVAVFERDRGGFGKIARICGKGLGFCALKKGHGEGNFWTRRFGLFAIMSPNPRGWSLRRKEETTWRGQEG